MPTRYLLIIVVLLFTIAFIIGAKTYFWPQSTSPLIASEASKNSNSKANTIAVEQSPVPDKTPQQQMEEILDCAAMLAVHESQTRGELIEGSTVFELISYALGKSQELAIEAGLNKGIAKTRYDEKTIDYFLAYRTDPALQTSTNTPKIAACEKQLSEYEPGAQIQSAINKAKAMAGESSQPNSNTTTEKP